VNSGVTYAFPPASDDAQAGSAVAALRQGAPRMANATPEPISDAVHLCVDMQNIFSRGGTWETPWMERVLPAIVEIAARYTARTVFTRFITPLRPEDRPGRWRRYFTKWQCATRDQLPPEQLELVPALRRFAPPAHIIDKPAYSAFAQSALASFLDQKGVGTVVITGAETDVCVLSTVLDAVDLGLRVVIVEDALCSSFDAGHDALMTLYRNRFAEQIELIRLDQLPRLWREAS
jgi:nicotinamidase-related amidase